MRFEETQLQIEVHAALRSLYDSVALARSALAERFPELQRFAKLEERGSRLRRILLNAIESLQPQRRLPFGSPESRSYDVLTLRYVENRKVAEVARELSLSERQVHRDLLRAERVLAGLLLGHLRELSAQERTLGEPIDPLLDELSALRAEAGSIAAAELLSEVQELLGPLAARLSGRLELRVDAGGEECCLLATPSLALPRSLV